MLERMRRLKRESEEEEEEVEEEGDSTNNGGEPLVTIAEVVARESFDYETGLAAADEIVFSGPSVSFRKTIFSSNPFLL